MIWYSYLATSIVKTNTNWRHSLACYGVGSNRSHDSLPTSARAQSRFKAANNNDNHHERNFTIQLPILLERREVCTNLGAAGLKRSFSRANQPQEPPILASLRVDALHSGQEKSPSGSTIGYDLKAPCGVVSSTSPRYRLRKDGKSVQIKYTNSNLKKFFYSPFPFFLSLYLGAIEWRELRPH